MHLVQHEMHNWWGFILLGAIYNWFVRPGLSTAL